MGRELKRVPLNFDYEIGKIWKGYLPSMETFRTLFAEKYPYLNDYHCQSDICSKCEINNGECSESADYCLWYNENNKSKWFKEVPVGEGYQLWETTSEGSPQSPVFATIDELCEWCAKNATTFADCKTTKNEWKRMLTNGEEG